MCRLKDAKEGLSMCVNMKDEGSVCRMKDEGYVCAVKDVSKEG